MKIAYFGVIADLMGTPGYLLEKNSEHCLDLESLKEKLFNDKPEVLHHVFRIAVNQQFVTTNILLSADDEIAFMPPFSGG